MAAAAIAAAAAAMNERRPDAPATEEGSALLITRAPETGGKRIPTKT
jgi:hypothetical protein